MAILEAVFANKPGQTPQEVDRRRRMAQALIEAGAGGGPPSSGLELAGRLAMTLTGQYQAGKAERQDATNRANANSALINALYGPSDTPSSGSASGMPTPGAAGEMSATSPSPKYQPAPVTAKGEVADYIRQSAAARGIDPDIALRVAMSEGGVEDPVRQSLVVKNGVREPSYGPFQLYMGGGLGNKALAAGIDPRDPNQWRKGVDFALDQAKAGGWSPWYGARKLGITGMMGIGNSPSQPTAAGPVQASPNQVASLDPSAGMPMPGATGQMRASDPSQPMTQAAAPPLPPPTTVAPAPQVATVPPAAAAPNSQVAQALTAPTPPQYGGYSRETISRLLSDPYTAEAGQMLLMQEMKRRNDMQAAQYEQQLKMNDPKYKQDLEKGQIELQNLREPKMSPAEQANIDLNRQKFATEQENRKTLSASEQATADAQNERLRLDRDKFEREMQQGQWEKMTDGRLYNKNTGEFRDAPPPVPGSVPPKFDDIASLRKEVYQLPSYKNMSQALPIYRSMAETAGRNTKASDLNLVYGLGKIMDPNSVVREGEMVMVKNTASLPDWLQGAIASLNGGAALTPETRQAIMTEAYGRMQGYDQAFKQDMGQYQGIVQRNNLNQADIIPDLGAFEPWKPDPNAAVPAPATPPGHIGTDWQELSPGVRIRKVQ